MRARFHHTRSHEQSKDRSSGGLPTTLSGRLVCHRDGYGFVIPEEPLPQVRGDIYIAPHAMSSGMHGDRVLVSEIRMGRDGRAEGRIQRVIERAQTTVG